VDTLRADDEATRNRRLTDLGLPTVLSQTFRTLIHSRMTVGMAAYSERFPKRDLVLVEPQPDDYRMFFTNIFSFASRRELCEYAYRATRRDLLKRYDELAPVFGRHGLRLRHDVLADQTRDLWAGVGLRGGRRRDRVEGPLAVTDALDRALTRLEAFVASEREAGRGEKARQGPGMRPPATGRSIPSARSLRAGARR
jgi:hypothetical protein